MSKLTKAERIARCERQRNERALQLQRGEVPTAPDLTKPESDHDRGIYFWDIGSADPSRPEVQLQGSHVTPCTPHWCAAHATAFAVACVPCVTANYFQARRTGRKEVTTMLEAKTVEKEIERDLSDDECDERRAQFEKAWEEEQQIKASKASEMHDFNQQLKEVRALQKACHDAFTTGTEKVKVECIEKRNERLHQVEYFEKGTGKLLDKLTRPMTAEERQTDMFSEDGKEAKVKAKSNGAANGKGGHEKPELTKEPLKASVGELAASKRHEAVAASARKKSERKASKKAKPRKGARAEARA